MSVIRVKKAQRKPYVILDTTALNDTRLSFRAKGLHTYLMSKPDDWQVYIEQLEKESPKEGRDAIRGALSELEQAGYLKREKIRGAKGRMAGWSTTIYETPALAHGEGNEQEDPGERIGLTDTAPPTTDFPMSARPTSDEPTSVPPTSANPQLLSIDLNQGLTVLKIEENSSTLSPHGEKLARATTPKSPSTDYTSGFELAWAAYPPVRKQGKVACFALWQERGLDPRAAEIAEKLERLSLTLWKDTEKRFIPMPSTWFHQARYEDELIPLDAVRAHETHVRLDTRISEKGQYNLQSTKDFAEMVHGTPGRRGLRSDP